jgi:HK97 family phage major capsid protein
VIVGQSGDERRMQDPMLGWRDVGEFAIAVQTACRPGGAVDPRLATPVPQPGAAPTDFHRETGSTDGYMVPPQARQEIYQIAFNDPLLDLITREPTTSNSVDLLADETTPWGATGVQARWRSEGTQMTPSRLVTDPRRVIAHELYAFVLATGELLQDAPRLASRLTLRAGQAIRWKLGAAFMRGTGAGQPLGWLNAGALVTQAATDNGSPAVNLTALNVAEMYSRMLADFIGQAVWVANTDVLPSLITLRLGENTIWTPPATGIAQAPGGFIVGRPLMFSEHCATVGSVGDLQFIAPAGYYATQRGELESASSLHLFFDYNVEAFRWIIRVGGMPFLSAPVSPAYGSSTKSHFVALAAR